MQQGKQGKSKRILVRLKFLVPKFPKASVHLSPHLPLFSFTVQSFFGFLYLILLHFCPSMFRLRFCPLQPRNLDNISCSHNETGLPADPEHILLVLFFVPRMFLVPTCPKLTTQSSRPHFSCTISDPSSRN